jgi:hypothetical protein
MRHILQQHDQGIKNGGPMTTHWEGVHGQNNRITTDMAPLIYCKMPAECLDLYVKGLHGRPQECKS